MPATVVVGTQWGEEGAGLVTDLLQLDAATSVRAHVAEPSPVPADGPTALRAVPRGVRQPHVLPVVGNGVALDPLLLLSELQALAEEQVDTGRLRVSGQAHLVLPFHREIDKVTERYLDGTRRPRTRSGSAPAYADKATRAGFRVQDLLDPGAFRDRLAFLAREKTTLLAKLYNQLSPDVDVIEHEYLDLYAPLLAPLVADTVTLTHQRLDDGVVLEDERSTFLDQHLGAAVVLRPVASSAAVGAGVGPGHVDRVVGVAKAYVTRRKGGPMPTEDASLAAAVGDAAPVGAPAARVGWFDAVLARTAVRANGVTEMALTGLHALGGLDEVALCVAYEVDGHRVERLSRRSTDLAGAVPVYERMPGWPAATPTELHADLPGAARAYVDRLQQAIGTPVTLVGTDELATSDGDRVTAPGRGRS